MSQVKTNKPLVDFDVQLKAFQIMCHTKAMAEHYESNKEVAAKYVHSTSRGHEAIQIAAGFNITENDYASLYYRDESVLLALGFAPYELMLQLMAKKDDPFSGGRCYYSHPSVKKKGYPTIPHQSSATGMQAIPATGMAHAIQYFETQDLGDENRPVVLCSLGDGAVTEGEVSEALQMAVLKMLPIVYLVQDNDWGISATGDEMRAMDAYEFAGGFKGMKRFRVDGADFAASYDTMKKAVDYARIKRAPVLVHAHCPLLGHHTSGVRREFYRPAGDLEEHGKHDPWVKLREVLLEFGMAEKELDNLAEEAKQSVEESFERARKAAEPEANSVMNHVFAPSPITEEKGKRQGENSQQVMMVDAALHAIEEIMAKHPDALLYGQDVGINLGGVFREAATLADKYGVDRVFNTPIQEAYIVGSTAGMSAVGAKPIVEIQFADYVWPALNQLVEELSKSCYITMGKFPVQSLIRIPIGAYGGGGPYHSGSIESTLLTIRGIKVIYPSNAADMKGLLKSAFYDPNPVISLEHKGLYWSKVPGTEWAKQPEPDEDYVIPLGKGRIVQNASQDSLDDGESIGIITYGMGVHWSLKASKGRENIEIFDLRSLNPIDWEGITDQVSKHGKILIVSEEPELNSFAESLAGRISMELFELLDAPPKVVAAKNVPAIPMNVTLESEVLPSAEKVTVAIEELMGY